MRPQFLHGIRFTDLTWAGAGAFATKIFSDFGAEVIKIESTTRPDNTRLAGPFADGIAGLNRSGYFASRNTGKKSFTVDLKSAGGRALIDELIRNSDVISNNFAAGAMERLGLDYENVRRVKSDIIYLGMPTYGDGGPLAAMPALGMTISAITGLTSLTGYEAGPPVGPGTHFPDHAANPYHAAFAVMAALRLRRRTGRGMKVDLSQVESMFNFVGLPFMEYSLSGQLPKRVGNRSLVHAPHNVFPCKGEDRWCAIAVLTDAQWLTLCDVIDRVDLAGNGEFRSAAGRLCHFDAIEQAISTWTAERAPRTVMEALQQSGVPAGIVADVRDLMDEDPQLRARAYWQAIQHPEMGATRINSLPYLIDGERITLDRPPLLGEHTDEVLARVLGYGSDRIEALRQQGVLD